MDSRREVIYDSAMISAQETESVCQPAGGEAYGSEDQRILLHGVSWGRYVALRELLDEVPGLRMTYLKGLLEIMSPSKRHETIKKVVARLVEVYALERDIELTAYGSTTYRNEAEERGFEPDECYCIGDDDKPVPDFAIEVALSSSGIDKLAAYRGLGVPEVWIWSTGRLAVFGLGESGYTARDRSAFLPDLDLALLSSFAETKSQSAAVRAFRDRLRQR